jgi:hypothetical protein
MVLAVEESQLQLRGKERERERQKHETFRGGNFVHRRYLEKEAEVVRKKVS